MTQKLKVGQYNGARSPNGDAPLHLYAGFYFSFYRLTRLYACFFHA